MPMHDSVENPQEHVSRRGETLRREKSEDTRTVKSEFPLNSVRSTDVIAPCSVIIGALVALS